MPGVTNTKAKQELKRDTIVFILTVATDVFLLNSGLLRHILLLDCRGRRPLQITSRYIAQLTIGDPNDIAFIGRNRSRAMKKYVSLVLVRPVLEHWERSGRLSRTLFRAAWHVCWAVLCPDLPRTQASDCPERAEKRKDMLLKD